MDHNENGAFAARGLRGQTFYVDPITQMMVVRLASYAVASNPTALPAYQAVAE